LGGISEISEGHICVQPIYHEPNFARVSLEFWYAFIHVEFEPYIFVFILFWHNEIYIFFEISRCDTRRNILEGECFPLGARDPTVISA
jgi:hypothetical protein